MRSLLVVVLAVLGLLAGVARADMVELDDAKMSTVDGGNNGISFTINMQINTDSTGAPLDPNSSYTGCATNASPCGWVLGLQFENRPGVWLMLKDYYGMLSIPDLRLDAYVNPTSNTAFYNANRYITTPYQTTQTCINDIVSCNPKGMDSFMFTFANSSSTDYSDIGMYLNIGRMSIEFDSGASVCATVNTSTCGYNQDARGSFAGLSMSDFTQTMAHISVAGQVRIYGF